MSSQKFELTHRAIAVRYKSPITVTLILLTLENLIQLFEPLLLGLAIDGLIAGDRKALWIFLAFAVTGLGIGVGRRLFDTRAYSRIYRDMASTMAADANARGADISQITARASFVSEFTDFFEIQAPVALMAMAGLLGSVAMLFVISPLLCASALSVALLVGLVFYFSRRKIEYLNIGLNDEMERQVDILSRRDNLMASQHFSALARWRIRLSDLEARNFGATFFLAIILTAVSVFILVVIENKTEGQIFAALTYILHFTEATVMLPYTYQQYIRSKEISGRMMNA